MSCHPKIGDEPDEENPGGAMPGVGEEGACGRALKEQAAWNVRPLEEARVRRPCPAHEEEDCKTGGGGEADQKFVSLFLAFFSYFLPDWKGKAELLDLHLGRELGGDIGGEAGRDLDDDDLGGVHPGVVYQPGRPVINSVDEV